MKHKYAEMIKAKVDDMDLVLLVKSANYWAMSSKDLPAHQCDEYFLCHAKHEKSCRRWLNGGDVYVDYGDGECEPINKYKGERWDGLAWYMLNCIKSYDQPMGIKPKKEPRWIVVCPVSNHTSKL